MKEKIQKGSTVVCIKIYQQPEDKGLFHSQKYLSWNSKSFIQSNV